MVWGIGAEHVRVERRGPVIGARGAPGVQLAPVFDQSRIGQSGAGVRVAGDDPDGIAAGHRGPADRALGPQPIVDGVRILHEFVVELLDDGTCHGALRPVPVAISSTILFLSARKRTRGWKKGRQQRRSTAGTQPAEHDPDGVRRPYRGHPARARASTLGRPVDHGTGSRSQRRRRSAGTDGVLVSWAVPQGPAGGSGNQSAGDLTEDHPLKYASFGNMPA